MTAPPSPYRVLAIDRSATQADVRKAYQEALRARAFSRQEITQAFNQLRNPLGRLDADLIEVPSVSRPVRRSGARSFVDEAAAPLPAWSDLVAPDAHGAITPRDVEPPSAPYLPAGIAGPSAAVLPTSVFAV